MSVRVVVTALQSPRTECRLFLFHSRFVCSNYRMMSIDKSSVIKKTCNYSSWFSDIHFTFVCDVGRFLSFFSFRSFLCWKFSTFILTLSMCHCISDWQKNTHIIYQTISTNISNGNSNARTPKRVYYFNMLSYGNAKQ